jgi:hypothetical protein
VFTATIIKAMEGVDISETSVNFYHATWRNIPEDSLLHIHRRVYRKSHLTVNVASKNNVEKLLHFIFSWKS